MNKKTFIVPHDFTPIADNALDHAIRTAAPLGAQVYVLHVVSKEKSLTEAEENLNKIVKKFDHLGVDLIPSVRLGSIFEDIGDFAKEHHAELIFMGTHGAHGWQHITGSHALKVVTNSDVPFVIVQDKKIKLEGFKNIVVPMDLHKETKQKLAMVSNLATYFNSKVHVVTPDETDEFLQHHVQANIQFAKRFFAERNVEMDSAIVPSSGFDKEVVKYAVSIDADLIAIMNLNRSSFLSAITANYEQYIITNDAKIPTLIINPVEIGGSFHFPSYLV
jgi:nucleotide-binding universal stress UspA family protein